MKKAGVSPGLPDLLPRRSYFFGGVDGHDLMSVS